MSIIITCLLYCRLVRQRAADEGLAARKRRAKNFRFCQKVDQQTGMMRRGVTKPLGVANNPDFRIF